MFTFTSFVKFTKTLLFYSFITWFVLFLLKSNFYNSCVNYEDYYNVYSTSNCSYISDNYETPPEIIRRHTGVSETHKVTTEDGYILTLFRIPKKNPKGVILFQHGYACDSTYWLAQSNESVALYFWKSGYDVWLANNRGTDYSKQHINLSPEDEQFWTFSFHEVGYYDLTASIDYIKDITNVGKIVYIGFSLGSSAGSVYSSMRSEKAEDSVKVMVQLAPAYASHSPWSIMNHILPLFAEHMKIIRFHRFTKRYWILEHDGWFLRLIRFVNKYSPFKKLASYCMSVLFGWTPDEVDPKLIHLMIDTFGTSSSWHMWQHYAQMHKQNNKLLMYDYGKEENLKLYGNESPPLYPLENIKIPIFLVTSRDDWLSDYEDAKYMYDVLPDRAKIYGMLEIEGLNHMDFYFGKHRMQKIYDKILMLLDNVTSLSL